jgi:hypothetical protein
MILLIFYEYWSRKGTENTKIAIFDWFLLTESSVLFFTQTSLDITIIYE